MDDPEDHQSGDEWSPAAQYLPGVLPPKDNPELPAPDEQGD